MLDEPFRSVYRFIARDGHIVWVRGEVKIVRDAQGKPVNLEGIEFDITEIKQADEALKRAHEELERTELQLLHSAKLASLGTLATGVAHELNQPPAGIRAIAQQLLREDELPEIFQEDLQLIEPQTHRMTKIINRLRAFARAPSQEVASVDINQVVQNCFIPIRQQLKTHGITTELI